MLSISALFSLFFLAAPAFPQDVPPTKPDVIRTEADKQPKPENGRFHSVMPLAGYNPTYGVFVGGGYFRKVVEEQVERTNWGLIAVISQHKQAIKTEWKGETRLSNFWRLEFRNELANGFESNYGLGNETRVEDRVDVPLWKDELDLYFPYYFAKHIAVGPGFEHRARHNHPLSSADQIRQKNPISDQEFTAGLVFLERVDFRNIPENPSLGWEQEFHVTFVQPYAGPERQFHTILNMEVSVFQYLLERDLVLAYSVAGGQIFGTPTYLNQFRLGGTDHLRGYFYDRFRGSSYYVEQTELRFPIWGAFSGTTFGEFGEVTDSHFSRAHVSYGGGLLIGLPPDRISKVRIDFAIGRDQRGVFVDFGHAF